MGTKQQFRMQGYIPGEQARREPYIYLPFEVPASARRIEVSYHYSDPVRAPFGMGPGNTVDIGVFDSRGYDFLEAPGFRGWSGADRQEFFLARDDATPGYVKGSLYPGEWNVVLGLSRLEPEGVKYDVIVTVDADDGGEDGDLDLGSRTEADLASAPVAAAGHGRWLKGDLHCHTVHSDGANTVEEMVRHAIELGLDFLAVTDHNTNTHHEELDRLSGLPIILIPGEEVTTYWGHANTWGLREWVDFRCWTDESMTALQRHLAAKGAMLSVNHGKCVGPPWLLRGWEGVHAMEVWQAPWRFYNWESLDRWDCLLQRGQRVVAVGGSDVHSIPPAEPRHPHGLAEPTTWVYASEPSEGGVLSALRAGRACITDSPRSPTHLALYADADSDGVFERMMGDEVGEGRVRFRVEVTAGRERRLWIVADGETLDIMPIDSDDAMVEFALDTSRHRYVRAELRGNRGRPERGEVVWAMTNPIWVKSGA
jgi:PHP domain